MAPILRELFRLLNDNNMAAEACFDRLSTALGSSHSEHVELVRTSIDALEYAEALASLERLITALEIALDE